MKFSYISRAIDFGRMFSVPHPRVLRGERVERVVDELGLRLRVLELLELGHALVVLDAGGLHLRDLVALQLVELPHQDDVGVLEDRLDEREQIERVGSALDGSSSFDRVEQVERERVVEREVLAAGRR